MNTAPNIEDPENISTPDAEGGTKSQLTREEIDKLITDNEKLAYYWANVYHARSGADIEDLSSQAIHALIAAANSYEPSKGKFSTFATQKIKWWLGDLNYRKHKKDSHEVTSLDAPVGGDGDEGDAEVKDKFASEDDGPETGIERREAFDLINDEIESIPEPKRSMVKRWMNGESYRDMQSDYGMSHTMIGFIVKDELAKLKSRLVDKGIVHFQDIWPESIEDDRNGKMVLENIVSIVSANLAIRSLKESTIIKM